MEVTLNYFKGYALNEVANNQSILQRYTMTFHCRKDESKDVDPVLKEPEYNIDEQDSVSTYVIINKP